MYYDAVLDFWFEQIPECNQDLARQSSEDEQAFLREGKGRF